MMVQGNVAKECSLGLKQKSWSQCKEPVTNRRKTGWAKWVLGNIYLHLPPTAHISFSSLAYLHFQYPLLHCPAGSYFLLSSLCSLVAFPDNSISHTSFVELRGLNACDASSSAAVSQCSAPGVTEPRSPMTIQPQEPQSPSQLPTPTPPHHCMREGDLPSEKEHQNFATSRAPGSGNGFFHFFLVT